MVIRPHLLKWSETTEATQDTNGYPVPGLSVDYEVKCRWHQTSAKTFKNSDSTDSYQNGRIRVDIDSPMPRVGQMLEVVGYFNGIAREVYTGGQLLSWRIDV